ncbi:hypothetical protein ACOSQ2_022774 [Xanthoceras sorbifolium]
MRRQGATRNINSTGYGEDTAATKTMSTSSGCESKAVRVERRGGVTRVDSNGLLDNFETFAVVRWKTSGDRTRKTSGVRARAQREAEEDRRRASKGAERGRSRSAPRERNKEQRVRVKKIDRIGEAEV